MIGDLERISDHAVNLVEATEELKDKDIAFSDSARRELSVLRRAVGEIVTITDRAFATGDVALAARVEPLEQVLDKLRDDIKKNHIQRLQKSECSIEHGFVLSDVLTDLERVSDHCSNLAACIIEMAQRDALDVHGYLHDVKSGGEEFHRLYGEYSQKYSLR
jgi:phosphate:Na+ symporter